MILSHFINNHHKPHCTSTALEQTETQHCIPLSVYSSSSQHPVLAAGNLLSLDLDEIQCGCRP